MMRQGCGTFTFLTRNHTTTNDPLRLCLHPEREERAEAERTGFTDADITEPASR